MGAAHARPNDPTRADDERVLAWLRLYDDGLTYTEIGALYDATGNAVGRAINDVERAALDAVTPDLPKNTAPENSNGRAPRPRRTDAPRGVKRGREGGHDSAAQSVHRAPARSEIAATRSMQTAG